MDGNNTTDEPKHSEKELWLRFPALHCNSVVEENIGSRQRDGHAMDQTSFVSCVIRGTVGVVLALDQYMKFRGESEPGIHRFEISEC